MNTKELTIDSNCIIQSHQPYSKTLNSSFYIGPFYSIGLKEFRNLFFYRLETIHHARACSLIIFHLSKYSRCLQTNMGDVYGLSWNLIHKVIEILLERGLITAYPTKRKTNINKYVNLTAYSISTAGLQLSKELNALIDYKISLMKK